VYFQATKPGKYHLFCTQYCGTDHSAMIGWVYVMTPEDYSKWESSNTSGASLAQNGERLFASVGCNACHNDSASARGPNLANVYNTRIRLTDGSTVVANEAFIRETILNPSTHVPAGYAPIMPTYQGQISEDGLIDLVEYIKSLDSSYRIQQTLNKSQISSAQASTEGKTVPAQGAAKP
jgi:cytochrome c oxidase subunit 2